MTTCQVDDNGVCASCKNETGDADVLQCKGCQHYFHGNCNEGNSQYCSKTFLQQFKKAKLNFTFECDMCLTKRENNEASCLKEQISALTDV